MARITRMTKRRLGELLQAEGLITEDQVRAGLEEQRKSNMFLGEALVKLGFVSEEVIAQTIVQQFSLPFISANQYNITSDVLNIFPERMYYEYQFIAADKIGRILVIIGAGLMNHDVLDELERLSECKVCQFVSTWKDIRSALEKYAKDLRKDQGSLNNLGNMLLEATPAPMPIPKLPPAPAGAATSRPTAVVPPASPKPAAATSNNNLSSLGTLLLEKPQGAKPPGTAKPMAPAASAPPPPTAAPGKTGLVLSPPKLVTGIGAGAVAKIASAPSGTAVVPIAPGAPAGPGQSARLSALSGARPPGTSAPQVKAPGSTGVVPVQAPAEGANADGAKQAPGQKTGLLGLFKKS